MAKTLSKYVALLRGINVGGNKKVPMADLKKVLEKMGFKNVKTLLASGNIIFEGETKGLATLVKELALALEQAFKFPIPVIMRNFPEVEKILEADPFKKIKVTPETRLYVTFMGEASKSKMKIPFISEDESFQILAVKGDIIFSVLDLTKTGTVDGMNILEKEFGKNITTRNWNTVIKIANA